MDQFEKKKYYTVRELADLLHFNERTIRDKLESGAIHGHQIGGKGKWFVDGSELARLTKGETFIPVPDFQKYQNLIEQLHDSLSNINAKIWPVWELPEAPCRDLRREASASLMELKSRYVQGKLQVNFIIEDRDSERFSTLLGQLEGVFPEFKDFPLWKQSLTVFIGHCQEICREIWHRVEKETGLEMKSPFIVEIGASKGRLYDVPKFAYEFSIDNYLINNAPQLQVVPANLYYHKYKFVTEKDPQRILAVGSEEEMTKCRGVTISLCGNYVRDDRIGRIIAEQAKIREQALRFQSVLAKVLAGTV